MLIALTIALLFIVAGIRAKIHSFNSYVGYKEPLVMSKGVKTMVQYIPEDWPTNKKAAPIKEADKKNSQINNNTFEQALQEHTQLMATSAEYRSGYNWAKDLAARKKFSPEELRSAAYRYADIEEIAAKGIMYAFRELADKQVAL